MQVILNNLQFTFNLADSFESQKSQKSSKQI